MLEEEELLLLKKTFLPVIIDNKCRSNTVITENIIPGVGSTTGRQEEIMNIRRPNSVAYRGVSL